jgi:hypothetical protein
MKKLLIFIGLFCAAWLPAQQVQAPTSSGGIPQAALASAFPISQYWLNNRIYIPDASLGVVPTNMADNSQAFSTAAVPGGEIAWTATGATTVALAPGVVDPWGGYSPVVAINFASTTFVYVTGANLPTAGSYRVSCWIRRNAVTDQTGVRLYLGSADGGHTATSAWQKFTFLASPGQPGGGIGFGLMSYTTPSIYATGFKLAPATDSDADQQTPYPVATNLRAPYFLPLTVSNGEILYTGLYSSLTSSSLVPFTFGSDWTLMCAGNFNGRYNTNTASSASGVCGISDAALNHYIGIVPYLDAPTQWSLWQYDGATLTQTGILMVPNGSTAVLALTSHAGILTLEDPLKGRGSAGDLVGTAIPPLVNAAMSGSPIPVIGSLVAASSRGTERMGLTAYRFYTSALTHSQKLSAARDMLPAVPFGLPLSAPLVVFEGDSHLSGQSDASVLLHLTLPDQLMAVYPGTDWYDAALSGNTSAQRLAAFPGLVAPLLGEPRTIKVFVYWIGTNDLAASVTPATVYSNILSECQLAVAAGATGIVLGTTLPRSNSGLVGTYEAQRQILNPLITGTTSTACDVTVNGVVMHAPIAIADVGATGNGIGTAGDSDGANYESLHIHLTGAGGDAIAMPIFQTAINSIATLP